MDVGPRHVNGFTNENVFGTKVARWEHPDGTIVKVRRNLDGPGWDALVSGSGLNQVLKGGVSRQSAINAAVGYMKRYDDTQSSSFPEFDSL